MMKLPFVSRKRYEAKEEAINYWRTRSKFILTIPYINVDGVGMVQVYCKDKGQAEKIKAKLSAKQTKD